MPSERRQKHSLSLTPSLPLSTASYVSTVTFGLLKNDLHFVLLQKEAFGFIVKSHTHTHRHRRTHKHTHTYRQTDRQTQTQTQTQTHWLCSKQSQTLNNTYILLHTHSVTLTRTPHTHTPTLSRFLSRYFNGEASQCGMPNIFKRPSAKKNTIQNKPQLRRTKYLATNGNSLRRFAGCRMICLGFWSFSRKRALCKEYRALSYNTGLFPQNVGLFS